MMRHSCLAALLFGTFASLAGAQTPFVDGVLSSTSDAIGCDAQPAPTPHYTQRAHAEVDASTPAPAPAVTCSDLGSTYQVSSDGRLYGLRRTASDIRREAVALAKESGNNPGVLAFQPTGLHVLIRVSGTFVQVKLKERESVYTVLFLR